MASWRLQKFKREGVLLGLSKHSSLNVHLSSNGTMEGHEYSLLHTS
jgi:hypothetical protein